MITTIGDDGQLVYRYIKIRSKKVKVFVLDFTYTLFAFSGVSNSLCRLSTCCNLDSSRTCKYTEYICMNNHECSKSKILTCKNVIQWMHNQHLNVWNAKVWICTRGYKACWRLTSLESTEAFLNTRFRIFKAHTICWVGKTLLQIHVFLTTYTKRACTDMN